MEIFPSTLKMSTSAKNIYKRLSSTLFAPKLQEPPPPPAATFICPISTLLMADPIVVPSGHSIDRPCILACRELNITPPHLHLNLTLDFPLIPNLNLRAAITEWCNRSGNPPPTPISQDAALFFVRGLMSSPPSSHPLSPFYLHSIEPLPYVSFNSIQEKWFLKTLNKRKKSSKEPAFAALIEEPFCTPRILATIILYLTADSYDLQSRAAETMHALSGSPSSRTHILLSGAVPPLIAVLDTGIRSARTAAAGALYKLSIYEQGRLLLGAFGAVPILLDKICEYFLGRNGRKDAAFALYHLSGCRRNLEVLVESAGVGRLMIVADNNLVSSRVMRRYALILLHRIMGLRRGREEVLNEGNIGTLLMMVMEDERVGVCSLAVMYRLCRLDLRRFRKAARAVGVEWVLAEELEEVGEISKELEQWGEIGKEMAWGILRVMRGECTDGKQLKRIGIEIGQGEPMEMKEGEEEEEEDDDDD